MTGINTDGNIGSISFDSIRSLRGTTSLLNLVLTTTNSKGSIALCPFFSECYWATRWHLATLKALHQIQEYVQEGCFFRVKQIHAVLVFNIVEAA